ncbi:MAG TPA: hypothetical protein VKR52_06380 [Terracidiphilus sp.]|nr:hypothetical protein [Terracidiphilus sp.]
MLPVYDWGVGDQSLTRESPRIEDEVKSYGGKVTLQCVTFDIQPCVF